MNKKIVKEGIKVDFHIHSVGSKYKDHAKVKNLSIENIGILIDKLNENNVNMCAITDHDNFEFDIYKKLKNEEGKGSIQKVLPGVEFSVLFEEKVIHIIVVFDDSDEEKLKNVHQILFNGTERPAYDNVDKQAYTEKRFLEIIKEINLSNIMIAHQKGTLSSEKKPRKNDVLSLGKEKMEELIFVDYFDSFEFKDRKNEIFNKNYLEKNKQKFKKNDIRFITGSDCHDWKMYPEDDNFKYTYLKCLPTFRGISMAITNYTRIKYVNSFFTVSNKVIDNIELIVDGVQKRIELSKGINVIIGDNSIGKSLLIHKLTNYAYLSNKTKMKKEYEKYLNMNNIEVKTKIDKNMIYEFDRQGGVREKFEQKKLKGIDFLKKYFPISPNVYDEKQIVFKKISEYIEYLKIKKEIQDDINNLSAFKICVSSEKSNSLTFNKVNIDYSDKIRKYKELLDNYSFILEKLKLVLENQNILEEVDIAYISGVRDEFAKLVEKYSENKKKIEFERIKVNSINAAIRERENIIQNIKTDEDKRYELFKNAKNKLINSIVKLVKLKYKIKEYMLNIDNKKLNISENVIGKYRFISKANIEEISNEYIIGKIRQPLKKKYNEIDIKNIEIDNLDELLPSDSEEGRDKITYYEELIKSNIEKDFKITNSIIDKDEKDKTKEMSSGFNSKIYFEILSYQDNNEGIYIIDQPEDDVSQTSIKKFLIEDFREMSKRRQIILITHNPQFIVNLDVDNVIFIKKDNGKIDVSYGALEYKDSDTDILDIISENIDGGIETINERWKRYEKNI